MSAESSLSHLFLMHASLASLCVQSSHDAVPNLPCLRSDVRSSEWWPVQLLERGRQAARHVKNARHAAQQVESMAAKEQREKLKPSALAALEGREQELKVSLSPTASPVMSTSLGSSCMCMAETLLLDIMPGKHHPGLQSASLPVNSVVCL